MSPVNFQDFRNIADTRRDATISVSHSTGNVQIKDNHVLNRLITWVRNKISPNPSRQYIEREAAYNKFLGAIGNEVEVPPELVDLVEQKISRNPYLVEYPDVKVNVRKEIATYIAGNGTILAN